MLVDGGESEPGDHAHQGPVQQELTETDPEQPEPAVPDLSGDQVGQAVGQADAQGGCQGHGQDPGRAPQRVADLPPGQVLLVVVEAGHVVGEVAEPQFGALRGPAPPRAAWAAVGPFGDLVPVDRRDEPRQQVLFEVVLGGVAGAVEQIPRVLVGRPVVQRPRQDDHQRGAEDPGEVDARRGPPGAQLVEDGLPRRFGRAVAVGGGPGGTGQVGGEVVDGEVGEFDACGQDQRCVDRADCFLVFGAAAGQHERQRGVVEGAEGRVP